MSSSSDVSYLERAIAEGGQDPDTTGIGKDPEHLRHVFHNVWFWNRVVDLREVWGSGG